MKPYKDKYTGELVQAYLFLGVYDEATQAAWAVAQERSKPIVGRIMGTGDYLVVDSEGQANLMDTRCFRQIYEAVKTDD